MSDGKQITRRSFLRGVVASTAIPYVINSSALGAGDKLSPSNRLNFGFIGLGGQGTGHLLGGAWTYIPGGYITEDDVQVVAVCDVQRKRLESAQQRCNQIYAEKLSQATYDGVKAYKDFREVLSRADIDAVLVAVPYHWATPISVMAMRSGKDVYCEKPVSITIQETKIMVKTARRYGRIYQAGTQQRSEYGGRFRQACELVRNGRIGELKEVYAYRQPGALLFPQWTSNTSVPVPEGFDWDFWLGPLPWRPYAGGVCQTIPGLFVGDVNWSPHHYDTIQWTVNPDMTKPVDIEYENDNIHYHYSNGVVIHSTAYPGEPVGPVGGACYVGTTGRIAVDRNNIVSHPADILKKPLLPNDERVYYSNRHSRNFLDCIHSRRETICNPEVAADSIRTVLIGGISLALKRSLRWDPVKLQFIGDPIANQLLSYTPRSPWII